MNNYTHNSDDNNSIDNTLDTEFHTDQQQKNKSKIYLGIVAMVMVSIAVFVGLSKVFFNLGQDNPTTTDLIPVVDSVEASALKTEPESNTTTTQESFTLEDSTTTTTTTNSTTESSASTPQQPEPAPAFNQDLLNSQSTNQSTQTEVQEEQTYVQFNDPATTNPDNPTPTNSNNSTTTTSKTTTNKTTVENLNNLNNSLNILTEDNKEIKAKKVVKRVKKTTSSSKPSRSNKGKGYFVQFGSYQHIEDSRALQKRIANMSFYKSQYKPFIMEITLPKLGTVFRLRQGPIPNKEVAYDICRKAIESNFECFVVNEK